MNAKVLLCPYTIDSPGGKNTRLSPQNRLSAGFCEPRRYMPGSDQALEPVFFIVTDTAIWSPASIVDGGPCCVMYCASLGGTLCARTSFPMAVNLLRSEGLSRVNSGVLIGTTLGSHGVGGGP